MSFMNQNPTEVTLLKSENEALKKKIDRLELMVKTYESAYKNGGSEEEIAEYMDIAMEIFHPEERVNGRIGISETDMDWLDEKLQKFIIQNHKANPYPTQNPDNKQSEFSKKAMQLGNAIAISRAYRTRKIFNSPNLQRTLLDAKMKHAREKMAEENNKRDALRKAMDEAFQIVNGRK